MGFGAFAAGFAEGFVDQTLSDRDRRLAQEDQLVQLGLASSMRQHEERTKREQAHREMYSQATQLAQQLNLVGEEALIFSQLNLRGGNVDKVISDIQSGTIQPISSTQMVRPTTDSPEAIDQQMMESGMADPSMVGAPEAQPEQEQRGGFWSDFLATEAGRDRRVQQGIDTRLEAVGIDPSAPSFTPPTPTSQLVMGGDTSTLVPLADITDMQTLERAFAIAETVPNVSDQYINGLINLGEIISYQGEMDELGKFIDGAKTPNELVISLTRAQEEGASEKTVQSIQSILSAVQASGFEAPTNQGEWLRQRSIAAATNDTDKLRFLNSLAPVFARTSELQLLSVGGQAVSATTEFSDGEIVYRSIQTGELIEGQPTVLPPAAREDRAALLRDLRPQAQAVRQQQQLVLGLAESALDLSNLLAENPAAATTVARGLGTVLQFGREVETIFSVANDMLSDSESISERELSAKLRQEGLLRGNETLESLANSFAVEDFVGASGVQLEQASRAYQAQLIILAMRAGAAEGQSGRALTNSLFTRLTDFIARATTEQQLNRNMSTYLSDLYRDLELLEKGLSRDNLQVQDYTREYGVSPFELTTAATLISESERLREAVARFNIPVDITQPETTSAPTAEPEPTTAPTQTQQTESEPEAPTENRSRPFRVTPEQAASDFFQGFPEGTLVQTMTDTSGNIIVVPAQ